MLRRITDRMAEDSASGPLSFAILAWVIVLVGLVPLAAVAYSLYRESKGLNSQDDEKPFQHY